MQPTSTTSAPRDFSSRAKNITFTADGDTFYGVPRVATGLLTDMVASINRATEMNDKIDAVLGFFDITLIDESVALIKSRMRDKNNPLELQQALDIIDYLVEVYATRPTQPSPNSSDGSTTEATGTSSTAGVPLEVSNLTISPSSAS
jgi:hypothetical protein